MKKICFSLIFILFSSLSNGLYSMQRTLANDLQLGSSLINAVVDDNLYRVQHFIREGACVDAQDNLDRTTLIWAAIRNNLAIAQALIKAEANLNSIDLLKRTALIWASLSNHIFVVRELIKAGANIDSQDVIKRTALMWAARRYNTKIVEELVKAGANLNLYDKDQQTAAMQAASKGYLEIVQVLVKAGADLTLKDTNQKTALNLAENNNHIAIVNFLKIINSLEKEFTQANNINLENPDYLDFELDSELAEILIYRLLNQQKYSALANLLKTDDPAFADISEDAQKVVNFIKKWSANTLNPEVARAILAGETGDFKDYLEAQVYEYAKENNIKPLAHLIRQWANTTARLEKFDLLPSNIASLVGAFSPIELNKKEKRKAPRRVKGRECVIS